MKLIIINAIFATILLTSFSALAENAPKMSKSELASYISGRINLDLNSSEKKIKKYCDGNECFVIVDR